MGREPAAGAPTVTEVCVQARLASRFDFLESASRTIYLCVSFIPLFVCASALRPSPAAPRGGVGGSYILYGIYA